MQEANNKQLCGLKTIVMLLQQYCRMPIAQLCMILYYFVRKRTEQVMAQIACPFYSKMLFLVTSKRVKLK